MQIGLHRTVCMATLTAALLPAAGCSSSGEAGDGATGGSGTPTGGSPPGSGGASGGTSGAAPGSGGAVASGGRLGTGGVAPSTGGVAPSTGGVAPSTGGVAPSTGGASGGNGGRVGTGGSLAGGTGGSGVAGRGSGGSNVGKAGGGGQAGSIGSGGGGATSAAGASGSGGASGTAPSAGCGKAAGLMNGKASIDVAGTMREYILALPDDYDENQPYRLIFGWHPWGGSAQQVASGGYYGLQSQAKGEAILVSPDGLDFGGNGKGWGNTNGQDIAFLKAMLERFRSQLCIDENRIFSTGFSFGGMFSFAAGCSATSMMRAIAPMAGNTTVAGCENGTRPVAVMGFHGVDDTVVAIDGGRKGRDLFVQRNGCTQTTMPASPSWCEAAGANYQPCTCVSYQGCTAGYPVTWCEFKGPHTPAPNSGATLWNFFSQF